MVNNATLESHQKSKLEDHKFAFLDFEHQNQAIASCEQVQMPEAFNPEEEPPPTKTVLNLEDLRCFEVIERQFEQLGVVFNNCIAIQPSNPAFPTRRNAFVLMGAPKSGFLEVTFLHPVQFVSALITSSQRLVLSAYNSDRQLLTQTVLGEANLANSDSTLSPNTLLSVSANDISCVIFSAFDGQFTVDDFTFL